MYLDPFIGGVLTCVGTISIILNILFITIAIKGRRK